MCKYYALDEHTAIPDVVLVSTIVWEQLSPQEKQWLQEAADESAVYQAELWKKAVEESLTEVEKAGVKISYPSKEPFIKETKAIYDQILTEQPHLRRLLQRIQNTGL